MMHHTSFKGFRLAIAAATAAALLVAGCGSSDDGATDTSASTSTTAEVSAAKADLITEGDQICTEAGQETNAEVQKRVQQIGENVTNKDLIDIFTDITLPATEELYQQLGTLKPPPEDAADYQAILDAADKALKEAKADPEKLAVPTGGDNPFVKVAQLQQEFGFAVCGAPDKQG